MFDLLPRSSYYKGKRKKHPVFPSAMLLLLNSAAAGRWWRKGSSWYCAKGRWPPEEEACKLRHEVEGDKERNIQGGWREHREAVSGQSD